MAFSAPTCTGYTFNGWNTSTIAKGTIGEKNIAARWTAISYDITYEYNIAESSASKNVQNGNPTTYTVEDAITFAPATRSGYDFVAWDRTNITRGSLGDITVNASWDIVTYTLEYDVNDSDLVYSASYDINSNPATYTVEDSVAFSRPACDGYTCNGWDTPAIAKGTVGDKKLTALWTAISYTINYNYNIAESSASKTVENSNPTTYTVEDEITFVPATRNGYDFSAWDRTDIAIGTMGDLTVNASWEMNTYTVTYILNGRENAEANVTTYTVEDGTIVLDDATGENLFCGWYEDNADGEYCQQIQATDTRDITLYALFDGTNGLAISYGTVTGYTGNSNAVTIPSKYKGLAVQAVGDYAFDGCGGITSITFPEKGDIQVDADKLVDIQNDSNYPFVYENGVLKSTNKADSSKSTYKITALKPTTISFKYRVSSENNYDYLTIYKNTKQLAKISGNTSYVDYSVDLQVGDYLAFEYSKDSSQSKNDDCGYIQIEATLFNQVSRIGAYAFRGCTGLEDIIIPDYITAIGESAFYGCSGLTAITVAQGNEKYHSENNCLIESASKTLILGCQNSIIPTDGSVTAIGSSAFAGCIGLTSITIPENIVNIGNEAFSGCNGLASVTIPESIVSVGSSAFKECIGLETVNWNATACTSAGSSSNPIFTNCSNLTALNVGNNVTTIPSYTFKGCSGLTTVNWNATACETAGSSSNPIFANCSNL
ncbi:MAG: leucine-rich repeat protein, partial [Clostridia bacterium]|nr:leucine-rich repeat protein [Clostridia bacterium]